MYKQRIADTLFERKLLGKGAVLIEGPKWCGKTTTAHQFAKSVLDLGDSLVLKQSTQMMEVDSKLLLQGETPRLIDEWQTLPAIWDSVRNEIDKRNQNLIDISFTIKSAWLERSEYHDEAIVNYLLVINNLTSEPIEKLQMIDIITGSKWELFLDEKIWKYHVNSELDSLDERLSKRVLDGENYLMVMERCRQFLSQFNMEEEKTIAVVAHFHLLRCMIYVITQIEFNLSMFDLMIPNAKPLIFDYASGVFHQITD